MPNDSRRQSGKSLAVVPTKKPWYQKTVTRYIPWLFTGFLLVGSILDSINNAVMWVTPTITVVGTIATVVVFIVLHVYLKRSRLFWVSEDGQKIHKTGLGDWAKLIGIGVLVALWLPRFISSSKDVDTTPPTKNMGSSTSLVA